MICKKCGHPLEKGDEFCINCGSSLTSEQVKKTESIQKIDLSITQEPDEVNNKNKTESSKASLNPPKQHWPRWAKITMIFAATLILIAAVLVPILIEKNRAVRYETALNLMDQGEIEVALDEFISLKTYKKSETLAEECQNCIDYENAAALMTHGDYELAKSKFLALGEYSDAADRAISCQNAMDYNDALELMNSEKNEDALEIFTSLGDYKFSKNHAAECQNRISYYAAVYMMELHNYSEALTAFKSLGEFRQSNEYIIECENQIHYAEAIALYEQGDFYAAYCSFNSLADFSDSNQYTVLCIQNPPETSEIYRNDQYISRSVSLDIFGPANDEGILTLIKVYTQDDELVSVVFINGDDKINIKLPSGSYSIKRASGYMWFGENDMFGDEGYYLKLLFTDNDYIRLSSNYVYTLRFSVTNGNVEGDKEDREDF